MASPEELIDLWSTEKDFTERDRIVQEMIENDIFPSEDQAEFEKEGLYPDIQDPEFLSKLMKKKEYKESTQPSVKSVLDRKKALEQKLKTTMDEEEKLRIVEAIKSMDKCNATEDFELSPVQRFLARFLSPKTPYRSALVNHGVGVGKTCTAITIAEAYLEMFPGKKVYIVAPRNIQAGFYRTIFDINNLRIGSGDTPNHHVGCTGNKYLNLTNNFTEKNKDLIKKRVDRIINKRYEFFGYQQFYNYIKEKIDSSDNKSLSKQIREGIMNRVLRDEFSSRLIIIDEAHNLRDATYETADDAKDDASLADSNESKAGKLLTPYLKKVLSIAEDITFVLMTATPMYNSYEEIIFLMNLLLINEKRDEIRINDIFDTKNNSFTPEGKKILGEYISQFVSYMRGENPLTFPLRLKPQEKDLIDSWPSFDPKGDEIEGNLEKVLSLPCVKGLFDAETEEKYFEFCFNLVQESGMGLANMDRMVQAGNFIFPGDKDEPLDSRSGFEGFNRTFKKEKKGGSVQYTCNNASWLEENQLQSASGKAATLLDRINKAKGVTFVYSRFVNSGALAIAFVLEANGYLPYGKSSGFLGNGNQNPKGRKCALCEKYSKEHDDNSQEKGVAPHKFTQARYILLTGNQELSPNNANMIEVSRSPKNVYGSEVKVILGSQIAGEGLDLKYVREVFVFDSWYHLNKLEQIIGRGIRNCSHAMLPEPKRNCTITLLVNYYENNSDLETADLYSYRTALDKAVMVGEVTRTIKEYAIDCSLNRDAIILEGLDKIPYIIDSQGEKRENVSLDDTKYSSMCDYLEDCSYQCRKKSGDLLTLSGEEDTTTYDEYTARFHINKIRKVLQSLFSKDQSFKSLDDIFQIINYLPKSVLFSLLKEIIHDTSFVIRIGQTIGKIIYKNGYFMFQPDFFQGKDIPIAIRLANIPIPRDHFIPQEIEKQAEVKEEIDESEDSEELWNAVIDWVKDIQAGKAQVWNDSKMDDSTRQIPVLVQNQVELLKESEGLLKNQLDRISIITWMYTQVRQNIGVRNIFAQVVLQFFWDEFITVGTKRQLILQNLNDPFVSNCVKDEIWEFQGRKYVRLVNPFTYETEYYCDGDLCSTGVKIVLEREKDQDPLLQNKITNKNTGYKFGFLGFKKKPKQEYGKVVFKKSEVPSGDDKLTTGQECSISSAKQFELDFIEKLGTLLEDEGKNDFGLSEGKLGKIKNSMRFCTIGNLLLRYMDKMKLGKKRWFYRTLEYKLQKENRK